MNLKYIGSSHYKLSDRDAGKLAKATPKKKLPDWGWQLLVNLEDGRQGWLYRTPYRHELDSPERGWVWCVLVIRPNLFSRGS